MKLTRLILFTSIAALSFACHKRNVNKGETTGTTTSTTASTTTSSSGTTGTSTTTGTTETNQTTTTMPDTSSNYGLVASFYSIGSGTDYKTIEAYDKFLEGYGNKVNMEKVRWGREGEIDYCLKLSNMSAAEKKDFIDKSRAILEKSDRVHIYENSPCVHKK